MSKARQGKGALITGGSQGRGPVVAVSLADQGTDIAFTYAALSAKAESVLDRVKVEGVRAIAIRCDQADTSGGGGHGGRARAVDQVVSAPSGLATVIHDERSELRGGFREIPGRL